jgi:DNA replication and repair protein RecF
MWVERLEVAHVRNLVAVDLTLSPGLNLFCGPNGAGKTALLEAMHLLTRGRSFRGSRVQPLIQHGQPGILIRARVQDEARGGVDIALAKNRDAGSDLRVAGQPERRLSAVAGLVPQQLFLPDGSDLVFGGPGERRRFLDWGVFHVKPPYLSHLQAYQRALRQRNALLAAGVSSRHAELGAWTEQLDALAETVDAARRDYLAALEIKLGAMLDRLVAGGFEATLEYRRGWPDGERLAAALGRSLDRDVKFASTQLGPHRAELRFSVGSGSGSGNAAELLSRGQGKLLASALRLAQVHVTRQETGRSSLLLIDDLGAELDRVHSHRFFELLADSGCQVLATCVEPMRLAEFGFERRAMFHVERGLIRPVAHPASESRD